MILQETPEFYVTNPAAFFSVDSSGTIYVPDAGSNRLLRFTSDGRPAGSFGGPGSGPGEFSAISPVGFVASGVIFHGDYRLRRINLYDPETQSPMGQVRLNGRLTGLQLEGNTLWVATPDHESDRAIASLNVASLTLSDSSTLAKATIVPLPAEYIRYPQLREWDDVKFDAWRDTIVIAFGGVDYVYRYRADGSSIDSLYIPHCRRQGVPRSLLERWFRSRPRTSAEELAFRTNAETKISALLGLFRLSDGTLVVWNQDPQWEANRRILRGVAFLSAISPDFRKVCVDAQVEAPGSGRPRITIKGNDVLMLDQVLSESPESSKVTTVMRRYRFDTIGCHW